MIRTRSGCVVRQIELIGPARPYSPALLRVAVTGLANHWHVHTDDLVADGGVAEIENTVGRRLDGRPLLLTVRLLPPLVFV